MVERDGVDLHGAPVLVLPFLRNATHHHRALVARRHAELQPRRQVLELLRHDHFVAEEHDGDRRFLVVLRDVLDHPHVDGIVQERVEIEEHVDAGRGRGVEVAQQGGRFGECFLGRQVDVRALQALRAGPLEYVPVTPAARPGTGLVHEGEHALFLARLDHDEREAGGQEHLELPARVR